MEYIAHKKDGKKPQSVREHCERTAKLAAEYACDAELEYTARLAGRLHDYGKLCTDFYKYINEERSYHRGEIDHCFAGARYITELAEKSDSRLVKLTAEIVAHIVISHHGLHDWLVGDGEEYCEKRIYGENESERVVPKPKRYDEIKNAAEALFPREDTYTLLLKASEEINALIGKLKSLPNYNAKSAAFYMGMTERFLQSCLIDADRSDTAEYMEDIPAEEYGDTDSLWEKMHSELEARLSEFADRTDKISVQRRSISDRCADFANHPAGAVRLIVPTGGGKTLSSLRYAVEYCRKFGMKKILYTAPYMSILEQNSEEFRKIAGEDAFLEHHSNILPELEEGGELAEYELLAERWSSPVIATTLVQLLNSLFSGSMSCVRRMHRLSRAVIIIDEIQSLPLKCVYMFNLAVNFLTKICGSTVVLCSATQPLFEKTDFPMLLDENELITGDYSEDFEKFRRTETKLLVKNGGYSAEEAADICMGKFRENGNLLVIVNTKSAAAELFDRLNELNSLSDTPAEMSHISTNMCPMHRAEEIRRIRGLLAENKPVICVTTQLIEAGVDISFNCVVRSLAGLDSAAQAAGRCNRHGRDDIRSVYILELNSDAENLSRLREIREAQNVSRSIINSRRFEDVLSPESLSAYFDKLYSDKKNELEYKATEGSITVTLLDLLSKNEAHRKPRHSGKMLLQSVKTAGSLFEVIDSSAQAVIVPYNGEARALIEAFNGADSAQAYLAGRRKVQQYAVSVYSGMMRKLEEAGAVYRLKCGAIALKEGFYNKNKGVVATGETNDDLFF